MRLQLPRPGRRRALQQRIAEVEQRLQGRRADVRARAGALHVDLRASITSPPALLLAGGLSFLITRRWIAASRVSADGGEISWRQFVLVGLNQLHGCIRAIGVVEALRSAQKSG